MYKNSTNQLHYIKRAGSHSTKESRTGRIDAIPAWAQEPEDYYNSIRDQYRLLADQLIKLQTDLTEINIKLKVSLPRKEFDHLTQHRERLRARYTALQSQASSYRALARASAEKSWTTVFFYCAATLLKPEDFALLQKETRDILARPPQEINKGEGELTEQQRRIVRAGGQRQKRRRKFREHYGKTPDDYVVRNNKIIVERLK